MAGQELVDRVKKHVITEFDTHATPGVCFHDLARTNSIVKAVKKISENSKLLKKDLIVLELAAWFYDIGYLENADGHKQNSAKQARAFLEQENIQENVIKHVTDTIMNARPNHNPMGPLEQILHDADSLYLSKKSFPVKNEMRRKEMEFLNQTEISPDVWMSETIGFLESHQYFTEYGRTQLTTKKDVNLLKLKMALSAKVHESSTTNSHRSKRTTNENLKAELGSEKGIETLFRISASNNQRLFTLADNKAHILITVNSIIISIIISVLIRKLAENPYLTWPTFILLGVSFASTVFAILATRPKIDGGTFSETDLKNKQVNLIYFGNFHQMTVDEYINGMEVVLGDRTFLYQTLIRDAFWHGNVLGKKYNFLRKAYNVFLFGLFISITAFVIAFVFHQ
jgi:Family of unknown function (DUF5706)